MKHESVTKLIDGVRCTIDKHGNLTLDPQEKGMTGQKLQEWRDKNKESITKLKKD